MERKEEDETMESIGYQTIGRPKLRWTDSIQKDLKKYREREVARDRRTCRMKTVAPIPNKEKTAMKHVC